MNNLYNEKIEGLISAALADGVLTEKEKQVLFKKAQAEGIDLDEFEMVLDARLVELKKAEKTKLDVSAPKSNKYGDVRKCPSCGAIVPSLVGVCPECGYEFSGIEANFSSQKLWEELNKTSFITDKSLPVDSQRKEKKEFDNQRKLIIEGFPVPNTKADLFEFLAAIKPRMRDSKDPLSRSYLKKYEECIDKAKISFPNDVNFRPFIEAFDREKKNIKIKRLVKIFCIIIGIVVVLFYGKDIIDYIYYEYLW